MSKKCTECGLVKDDIELGNIKKVYEILVRIKNNLENVEDGDYSYDRCFNNILELTTVALDYIRRKL
jgi:hypothetical protein